MEEPPAKGRLWSSGRTGRPAPVAARSHQITPYLMLTWSFYITTLLLAGFADDQVAALTMATDGKSRLLPPPPKENVAFGTLPWNLNLPDHHSYIHLTTTPEKGWTIEHYDPKTDSGSLTESSKHYGSTPLQLYPSTTSLNYGTTIWEGLACRRSPTSNKAIVFRPQKNHERFTNGAKAMCLPAPSYELFMKAIQLVLQENADLIPPAPGML